jgi:hypothetical protein
MTSQAGEQNVIGVDGHVYSCRQERILDLQPRLRQLANLPVFQSNGDSVGRPTAELQKGGKLRDRGVEKVTRDGLLVTPSGQNKINVFQLSSEQRGEVASLPVLPPRAREVVPSMRFVPQKYVPQHQLVDADLDMLCQLVPPNNSPRFEQEVQYQMRNLMRLQAAILAHVRLMPKDQADPAPWIAGAKQKLEDPEWNLSREAEIRSDQNVAQFEAMRRLGMTRLPVNVPADQVEIFLAKLDAEPVQNMDGMPLYMHNPQKAVKGGRNFSDDAGPEISFSRADTGEA